MAGPFAGSTCNSSQYGGTQLGASQQFDSYMGADVPMALASQKVYWNAGQYPTNPATYGSGRFQALLNAGVQLVLCYKPPFKGLPGTTYPADRTAMVNSITAFVSAAATAGAPRPKHIYWQEPQNGQNGMSAAQCQQMYTYYSAATRGTGSKLIYDSATHGGAASMVAYYPGGSLIDEVLADFYGNTYARGVRVDGAGSLLAQAHADGKPFGFGELGSALSAASVPSPAVVRAYMNYCIGIITADLAAGRQVSDSMWFNGLGNNWNTINSASDFRVALLNALWVAYQGAPGPPPPPPPPPPPVPLVPASSTSVTFGPPSNLDAVLAAADDAQGSQWPGALQRQHIAFDPEFWSALMPNPQTIPATLTLQGTPPLNVPGGAAGQTLVSDDSGNLTLGSVPSGMVPTAVQTSNYTASPGDFVPCNVAGGSIVITLPSAPADQTLIGAKLLALGGSNTVTINTSGADTFDVTAGTTTMQLITTWQSVVLQYQAATGVWYKQTDYLDLGSLDARYSSVAFDTNPAHFQPDGAASAGGTVTTDAAYADHAHPEHANQSLWLAPSGALAETFPRFNAQISQSISSGTVVAVAIGLPKNTIVSNITFCTGSAAESGGSHGWYALLDSTLHVLAVSADQTGATAWGNASLVTLAMGSPYTVTTAGLFYVAVSVTASGMPNFMGMSISGTQAIARSPVMCGTAGTQNAPPAVNAQINSGTLTAATASGLYAYVS